MCGGPHADAAHFERSRNSLTASRLYQMMYASMGRPSEAGRSVAGAVHFLCVVRCILCERFSPCVCVLCFLRMCLGVGVRVVAVEGNVCAGKASYMRCARRLLEQAGVPVCVSERPAGFDALLHSDPGVALALLWQTHVTAMLQLPRGWRGVVLIESSPSGAAMLLPDGMRCETDESGLAQALRAFAGNTLVPGTSQYRTVYVYAPPDVSFDRAFRRGKGIPPTQDTIVAWHQRLHARVMQTCPVVVYNSCDSREVAASLVSLGVLEARGKWTDWQTVTRKKTRSGVEATVATTGA